MVKVSAFRFSFVVRSPWSGDCPCGTHLSIFSFLHHCPGLRRWLNPDPIGFEGGRNLYGFVGNDPINFRDQLGLQSSQSILPVVYVPDYSAFGSVPPVSNAGQSKLNQIQADVASLKQTISLGELFTPGTDATQWWKDHPEAADAFWMGAANGALTAAVFIDPESLAFEGGLEGRLFSFGGQADKAAITSETRLGSLECGEIKASTTPIKTGSELTQTTKSSVANGSDVCKNGADSETARVFWSGGDKMREAAEAWAKANNATTLEMTAAGQRLTTTTKDLDWLTEARSMWANESTAFAKGAQGDVHVFQWNSPQSFDNMTIWREFEFPVLKQQGNNLIYHLIDP